MACCHPCTSLLHQPGPRIARSAWTPRHLGSSPQTTSAILRDLCVSAVNLSAPPPSSLRRSMLMIGEGLEPIRAPRRGGTKSRGRERSARVNVRCSMFPTCSDRQYQAEQVKNRPHRSSTPRARPTPMAPPQIVHGSPQSAPEPNVLFFPVHFSGSITHKGS